MDYSKVNYFIYDLESYKGEFSGTFKDLKTGIKYRLDETNYQEFLTGMEATARSTVYIGYNNLPYDSLIIDYAIMNKHLPYEQLADNCKILTDLIINSDESHYVIRRNNRIRKITINYDLYTVGMGSLKEWGIKLHHEKLETLPFSPDKSIWTAEERAELRDYCDNDVEITEKVLRLVKWSAFQSKKDLIEGANLPLIQWGITDAQIVETKLADTSLKPQRLPFKYKAPIDFKYETEGFTQIKELYENHQFIVGQPIDAIKHSVDVVGLKFQTGGGGSHACNAGHFKDIWEDDFVSMYPFIMKEFGFIPRTMADKKAFFKMIDDRVAMKKINPKLANAMKVQINTVFGVSNKKNSPLYDPQALYHITLTGQLIINKYTEMMALAGYNVSYVNTDGIMFTGKGNGQWEAIRQEIMDMTGLKLETNRYKEGWFKDVSNYVLVKEEGGLKTKGIYDTSIGTKNHAYARVCYEASIAKLTEGKDIAEFIKEYTDPTGFILYQKFSNQFSNTGVYSTFTDKIQQPFSKVVRYVLSGHHHNNFIKGYNTKQDSWLKKSDSNDIVLINDGFDEVMSNVDIDRYIEKAYEVYSDLTNEEIKYNPKMEKLIPEVLEAFDANIDDLSSAHGKINLKVSVMSPKTKTLKMNTGVNTGILVLDVDDENSKLNNRLLKMISKDDLIIHSSQYTLDDVFAGKCRYKVAFKYHGRDIPKKKLNNEIEVFYRPSLTVAIAGLRDDGYEYLVSGKINPIHFDINDCLQVPVPFKLFPDDKEIAYIAKKQQKAPKAPIKRSQTELIAMENLESEEVDVTEFLHHVDGHVNTIPEKVVKSGTLLKFPCMFPEHHTNKKGANAYAFKRDGHYICKCQGEVCQHEYQILNKKLINEGVKLKNLPVYDGFGNKDEKVSLFLRPTGWGKTEAIAEEMINHLRDRKTEKLVILLQSKEAVYRLLARFDSKTNGITNSRILLHTGKIMKLISEELSVDWTEQVNNADIVISHQEYFKHAGDGLTAFTQCDYILNNIHSRIIIDEAHAFLEGSTRVDLQVGALYGIERHVNSVDNTVLEKYVKNVKQHADTAKNLEQGGEYKQMTRCMAPHMDAYGLLRLRLENTLYKGINYIDPVKYVENNFIPMDEFKEGHERFEVFKNPAVQPLVFNRIATTGRAIDKLFNSSQYVMISHNNGDKMGRRNVGHINMSVFSNLLLEKILTLPKSVILTTATFSRHHYGILDDCIGIDNYYVDEINEPIKKIGKIALLKSDNYKHLKPKIFDHLLHWNQTKALMFMPTISKAYADIHTYSHVLLNDNGTYSFGKRNDTTDTGDNMGRNVVVCALEGSPAKGYNHVEEIDELSSGFKLIYFDRSPVSPKLIKKYIIDGEVYDANEDYVLSSFIQAIGRAMRKSKDTLTLAFNHVDEKHLEMIRKYLQEFTTSDIIDGELTMTNLKIAIGMDNVDPAYLESMSHNTFYKKLKGDD